MPQDRKGNQVKSGDTVLLHAKLEDVRLGKGEGEARFKIKFPKGLAETYIPTFSADTRLCDLQLAGDAFEVTHGPARSAGPGATVAAALAGAAGSPASVELAEQLKAAEEREAKTLKLWDELSLRLAGCNVVADGGSIPPDAIDAVKNCTVIAAVKRVRDERDAMSAVLSRWTMSFGTKEEAAFVHPSILAMIQASDAIRERAVQEREDDHARADDLLKILNLLGNCLPPLAVNPSEYENWNALQRATVVKEKVEGVVAELNAERDARRAANAAENELGLCLVNLCTDLGVQIPAETPTQAAAIFKVLEPELNATHARVAALGKEKDGLLRLLESNWRLLNEMRLRIPGEKQLQDEYLAKIEACFDPSFVAEMKARHESDKTVPASTDAPAMPA